MAKSISAQPAERTGRFWLAVGITVCSVISVGILSVVIVVNSTDKTASAQLVLAAVLPLMGSWVGTVLAFYFSRENLEAATNSVTQLAQLTSLQKLQSTPVTDKWIPKDKMFRRPTPLDQIKLVQALEELAKSHKGNRLPVLSDKDYPVLVIHRSIIDRFLAEKVAQNLTPDQFRALTLQDLLNESDYRGLLATSFATVKQDATLADAKSAMERLPNCQDVFVTRGGTKEEEVLGWITNAIIAENATV